MKKLGIRPILSEDFLHCSTGDLQGEDPCCRKQI